MHYTVLVGGERGWASAETRVDTGLWVGLSASQGRLLKWRLNLAGGCRAAANVGVLATPSPFLNSPASFRREGREVWWATRCRQQLATCLLKWTEGTLASAPVWERWTPCLHLCSSHSVKLWNEAEDWTDSASATVPAQVQGKAAGHGKALA